ncbi:MAG: putative glycosyltransferase [Bacteroidetes bacterium]|nr:putative glycosyltransferase [Bacteroidota bacterium]
MSGTPRVSVIVPALNEEKLLPAMLAQFTGPLLSRHDIELIVSDGGSTDGTLAIARSRAHIVVENAARTKQTIAMGRNLGAAAAHGTTLVFLNADTLVHDIDRFFEVAIREAERPGTAGVTCSVGVYPDEETPGDARYHGFYNWFFYMMNRVGMGMGRGECHVIPRDVFTRVGGYADAIAAGEDYDMFRRLRKVGSVRFIRELLVYESPRRYRRYGYATVTASWFMNFLSVFFLHRSLLDEWKPVR